MVRGKRIGLDHNDNGVGGQGVTLPVKVTGFFLSEAGERRESREEDQLGHGDSSSLISASDPAGRVCPWQRDCFNDIIVQTYYAGCPEGEGGEKGVYNEESKRAKARRGSHSQRNERRYMEDGERPSDRRRSERKGEKKI